MSTSDLIFKLLEFSKTKMFNTLKSLLFLIPIFFISKWLFLEFNVSQTTSFYWDGGYNFFLHQNGIWAIVYFAFIYISVYYLETFIIPSIIIIFIPTINKNSFPRAFAKIETIPISTEFKDGGAKQYINKGHINKQGLFSSMASIPVFLTLWLIVLNNIIGYLFIIIIWYLFFQFTRLTKTLLN